MSNKIKYLYLIIISIFVLLLSGCIEDDKLPGDIALVNGRPITLREVQFVYDSLATGSESLQEITDNLHQRYADILDNLIVMELMEQELERRKIPVTDEEVEQLEMEARSGLSADEFSQVLLEEGVHIDLWRKSLKRQAGMTKFMRLVIRPNVELDPADIEYFYANNQELFKRGVRYDYLKITSQEEGIIKEFLESYSTKNSDLPVESSNPNLEILEVVLTEDRIMPDDLNILKSLKENSASKIVREEDFYKLLILTRKEPERNLTRAETYQFVETLLLKEKSVQALANWAEERSRKSTIKISENMFSNKPSIPEFLIDASLGSMLGVDIEQVNYQLDIAIPTSENLLGAPMEYDFDETIP